MLQFQFKSYGEDAGGPEVVEYGQFRSDAGAKSWAGRKAKRIQGPVDIARAGAADWPDRYLTTAHPADPEFWATGFRFYRLD